MIFFGEISLPNVLCDFLAHFLSERNHEGLDNRLIEPSGEVGETKG